VPETNQTTTPCGEEHSKKSVHRTTLLCEINGYLFFLLAKIATAQNPKKNKSPVFI